MMFPTFGMASFLLPLAATVLTAAVAVARTPQPTLSPSAPNDTTPSSAQWLATLPDGEEKRRFILDCTGCHQFDQKMATLNGRLRTRAEWEEAVTRMLGYAGATTGFPVISSYRQAASTTAWLTEHLRVPSRVTPAASADAGVTVTEFPMPVPQDLPHDLQVTASGEVLITGMMTHRMYLLHPLSGIMRDVPIPVPGANPRAVELAPNGDWWVVLGRPQAVARYVPSTGAWTTHDVGMYAHSVALAPDGSAWANGHFTRNPAQLAAIVPGREAVERVSLPRHPHLADDPGGPIPYEVRVAPDGKVWMSELQGNRLVSWDPARKVADTVSLPVSQSGPRRHDIARDGTVWVPAYSANALLSYTPSTRRFVSLALPERDAVPYVARVHPSTGQVWVGTSAADAVFIFDPARATWRRIALPSRGALVRHMTFDPRSGDAWLAYGASPGIAARVARVSLAP